MAAARRKPISNALRPRRPRPVRCGGRGSGAGAEFLSEKGVVILHDCNPPSEYHQREAYDFENSPARNFWNGTTWKAFYKFRHANDLYSICFDCDWGVGVISKKQYPFFNNIKDKVQNEFYEFSVLNEFRKEHLNLFSFDEWVELREK